MYCHTLVWYMYCEHQSAININPPPRMPSFSSVRSRPSGRAPFVIGSSKSASVKKALKAVKTQKLLSMKIAHHPMSVHLRVCYMHSKEAFFLFFFSKWCGRAGEAGCPGATLAPRRKGKSGHPAIHVEPRSRRSPALIES